MLVLGLGLLAFCMGTASGVIFGKIMSKFSKEPFNPMLGAAGVSAVPMSARIVHHMGQQENKRNFLLMHAMGPNVAGVIGLGRCRWLLPRPVHQFLDIRGGLFLKEKTPTPPKEFRRLLIAALPQTNNRSFFAVLEALADAAIFVLPKAKQIWRI